MTTSEDRLMALERRVNHLQTFAGPGQATALADGLKDLRGDLAMFRREMSNFRREMSNFRGEMSNFRGEMSNFGREVRLEFRAVRAEFGAELEARTGPLTIDVSGLKADMAEVLRRLPPPSVAN